MVEDARGAGGHVLLLEDGRTHRPGDVVDAGVDVKDKQVLAEGLLPQMGAFGNGIFGTSVGGEGKIIERVDVWLPQSGN
jgi:hypothetical protein